MPSQEKHQEINSSYYTLRGVITYLFNHNLGTPPLPNLGIYLDESGDFDFSPTGTKYYIFSVAWTFEPKPLADSLTSLRFRLLKQRYDNHGFHATADEEKNRNSVVSTLLAQLGWKFTTVLIEKAKVYPPNRKPNLFYAKYATIP